MRFFPVNIKQLFLLRKPKQDTGYIKKIFKKKIKISDNTTRDLTKGCDCMKKKSISVICAVLVISGVATVLVLTGNRGNVSNVKRVVGYSALYGENSIKEAFDVIEKKFAKDFEGCTHLLNFAMTRMLKTDLQKKLRSITKRITKNLL